jgi:hypothetical protein
VGVAGDRAGGYFFLDKEGAFERELRRCLRTGLNTVKWYKGKKAV